MSRQNIDVHMKEYKDLMYILMLVLDESTFPRICRELRHPPENEKKQPQCIFSNLDSESTFPKWESHLL